MYINFYKDFTDDVPNNTGLDYGLKHLIFSGMLNMCAMTTVPIQNPSVPGKIHSGVKSITEPGKEDKKIVYEIAMSGLEVGKLSWIGLLIESLRRMKIFVDKIGGEKKFQYLDESCERYMARVNWAYRRLLDSICNVKSYRDYEKWFLRSDADIESLYRGGFVPWTIAKDHLHGEMVDRIELPNGPEGAPVLVEEAEKLNGQGDSLAERARKTDYYGEYVSSAYAALPIYACAMDCYRFAIQRYKRKGIEIPEDWRPRMQELEEKRVDAVEIPQTFGVWSFGLPRANKGTDISWEQAVFRRGSRNVFYPESFIKSLIDIGKEVGIDRYQDVLEVRKEVINMLKDYIRSEYNDKKVIDISVAVRNKWLREPKWQVQLSQKWEDVRDLRSGSIFK